MSDPVTGYFDVAYLLDAEGERHLVWRQAMLVADENHFGRWEWTEWERVRVLEGEAL